MIENLSSSAWVRGGRLRRTGITLVVLMGLIHLAVIPEYLAEATYVGLLFLANAVGSGLSAYGIYRERNWGWLLGVLLAVSAFVGYIISRTVGLPGAPGILAEGFFDPPGLLSLIVEALFVVLFFASARARRG